MNRLDHRHEVLLDCLRAVAALLVMAGHVRGAFFVAWGDLEPASRTAINMAMFAATRLGREAVIVFFVLSGYLVGGRAVAAVVRGDFRLGRYVGARVARLYAVLVPAMVLTVVVDLVRPGVSVHAGLAALVVNLLFLQGIVGPVYGSNGPLWSLAYEGWYYVLAGLALGAFHRKGVARVMMLGAVAVIGVVLMLACPELVLMFPMWVLGACLGMVPVRGSRWALAGACVMLVATALFDSLGETLVRDYFVALAAAAFIVASRGVALEGRILRLGAGVAPYSFTLYAVHAPLLALGSEMLFPVRSPVAGPIQWLEWLAVCAALLFAARAMYWAGERHTAAVRAWLDRTFGVRVDEAPIRVSL